MEIAANSSTSEELRIAVVGTGRLARSLARTWPERIAYVVGREAARTQAVADLAGDARVLASPAELDELNVHLVWIATPDSAIESTCGEIAALRENWRGTVLVHSSGATPLAALEAFGEKGGETVALHPNVSLTGDAAIPSGLLWSVSGADIDSDLVRRILSGLEPRLVHISEELRPLYHAAASAAANYSVTLFALAAELYRRSGVDAGDAATVVAAFMRESIERSLHDGPASALTGPIARGDVDVVREQLRHVKVHAPELFEAFRGLAEATAWMVGERVL